MVNNVEAIGCKRNRYRRFLQKYFTSLIKLYIVEILLSVA